MPEIDRVTLREELSTILQKKYVALLTRGSNSEAVIPSLIKQGTSPAGMRFIGVGLPGDIDSKDGFENLFLSRLQVAISGLSLEIAQKVADALKRCPAHYTVDSHIREALDVLGREINNYLVIILHSLSDVAEGPLKKLLGVLREYSGQKGNRGEAGNKLRFLVVGGARLWHLCCHKTSEKSPFNFAHCMLLDDLSYEELLRIGIGEDVDMLSKFCSLTGGVPIFIEEAINNKREDFSDLSPYFSYLQDDWNALDSSSQEALRNVAEGLLEFPVCHHSYKCIQIPVVEAPWQDAFWRGFLRMRFSQLTWRSPIHRAFVEKCAGIEEAFSRSTLIKLDFRERIERLEKVLEDERYSRYKQEPLEEARTLALQTYSAELTPVLDALQRGERYETILKRVNQMTAITKKDWLIKLREEAIRYQDSFHKFLIKVVLSRAMHFLSAQFNIFLCYNNKDVEEVKEIGKQLKDRHAVLLPEEWEPRAWRPWLPLLELHISQIRAAAVFIGRHSLDLWQEEDLDALLHESTRRICPVITVILASAPDELQLPPSLDNRPVVDFRKQDPDPLERLLQNALGTDI